MKTAFFSVHEFEREVIENTNNNEHEITLFTVRLTKETMKLASGFEAICVFVNDECDTDVLSFLASEGIQTILTRSAGFNHINLKACKQHNIRVTNVPEYSPYAVAEHAVALMMALNRKLIRAHHRVEELNFSLNGLTGFDFHGKKVGIVGLGKIGSVVAKIMNGLGCEILASDPYKSKIPYVTNVSFEKLCKESDIITLHCPLTDTNNYMIEEASLALMKKGVMLINTSRGGLLNTKDVIKALKTRKIGYLGLDVYEAEKPLFFEDHSEDIVLDDEITRLLTFPNVMITSHQAFLTDTALQNIADTTFYNLKCMAQNEHCSNEIT